MDLHLINNTRSVRIDPRISRLYIYRKLSCDILDSSYFFFLFFLFFSRSHVTSRSRQRPRPLLSPVIHPSTSMQTTLFAATIPNFVMYFLVSATLTFTIILFSVIFQSILRWQHWECTTHWGASQTSELSYTGSLMKVWRTRVCTLLLDCT